MNRFYFLFAMIIIISGCNPRTSNKDAGEGGLPSGAREFTGKISISGANALTPLAHALAKGYSEKNPGVEFEVTGTSTGAGLEAIINGNIHLAMVSRSLTDEERDAGFFPVPVAKDAVVLIVNRENPFLSQLLEKGLDPKVLSLLYTGEKDLKWSDLVENGSSDVVKLYTRGDQSGAAALWAAFIYSAQDELKGIKVSSDQEMVMMVQADRFAVGYCNLNFAYDNVSRERKENIQVVPIDLDFDRKISSTDQPYETLEKIHRAIYLGLYPHSLCRKLCLVSQGKPEDPMLLDFLQWVLTEGQVVVSPTGYCEFNNAEKRVSLELLNFNKVRQ